MPYDHREHGSSTSIVPEIAPVCADCGVLQCLCRPRFFAGQLLTETDLNRLDRYIVEKHKLHNRYLHGWGVACGLEVACHPCEGWVTVRPGYALSGCGEDIIVCKDSPLDVCALIKKCRPAPHECDTRPSIRMQEREDVEQKWVLAICYDERPARETTTIKTRACPPHCGCGGGGKTSSGGCGCGRNEPETSRRSRTRIAPECEPTVLSEEYKYEVYRLKSEDRQRPQGALVDRFMRCLVELSDAMPNAPTGDTPTNQQIREWCGRVKQALADLFADTPGWDCQVTDQLGRLCKMADEKTLPEQYLKNVTAELVPILQEYLRHCICAAMLPPCPEVVSNACVPLATITVKGPDCKVVRICNLESRKFVTSFPNLQYWLSWIPYVRTLRDTLGRLCCQPPEVKSQTPKVKGGASARFKSKSSTAAESRDFTSMFISALARTPGAGLQDFSLAALGLRTEDNRSFLTDMDVEYPLLSLLFREPVAQLMDDIFPSGTAAFFFAARGAAAARTIDEDRKREEELRGLREEVTVLRERLDLQNRRIEDLDSRIRR